ncbi:MAG TPA: hypothetical protein VG826_14490 [Pirellulales bacterium]|nr:hypothetical protein [Pirellulales bacterium]
MNRRLQFSLRTLLAAMLFAAAFFGGMSVQKIRDRPVDLGHQVLGGKGGRIEIETAEMRDGTKWYRMAPDGEMVLSNAPTEDGRELVDHLTLPDGSRWQKVGGATRQQSQR